MMLNVHALSLSLSLILTFCLILRFLELSSILEPGRPPKTDKAAILVDAVRMVTQLRGEAQHLKESSESLQEKITELKVCLSLFFSYYNLTKQMKNAVIVGCFLH
jgi:hypothetical protein